MGKIINEVLERIEIENLLKATSEQLTHHELLTQIANLKQALRAAFEEINRHHKDFDRWEEMADNANKRAKMLEKQLESSLANNLCPDHRDKQYGKPCLACTIETLERKLSRATSLPHLQG